ncbi:hypothetical protein [Streptomyces rubiginosohelvolus]|uniref:hypothetical protein n=1 Tax=Streptomyces rubiginosohelvolus TaxID=67362 RepID=UPI002F91937D|nr:hypothetical protein OG475_35050 [Streptomyces rubiginosohelvolus]
MTGQLQPYEDHVIAELVGPPAPGNAGPAPYDSATAAVLAALDQGAEEHLADARPKKTRTSYARDWELWAEFHRWLAGQTGHALPLTAVTKGTLVAFVVWLDEMKKAAPSTIDRRITGVTVTARWHGTEVPKQATKAAREALKPMKLDPARTVRGRGKAIAATPAHLKAMNTATAARPQPAVGRRRGTQELPELARLRDRALATLAFGIAGRSEEVSSLDTEGITRVAEGLEVHVPSVKGRPPRDVAVAYGENPDTCPVRCWLAWKEAAGLTAGPAFLPVDQKGRLGAQRLGPDGCRLAITRAAERAGLDVKLTGHSARRGLVSTGRKRGKRAEKLRKQGGWAANSPVFWEYVDEGERWEDTATEGIGL